MEELIQIIKVSFPPFIGNVGILFILAWLAFVYGKNVLLLKGLGLPAKLLIGTSLGVAASLVQFVPVELIPGVFIDSRGVPIMFAGIIGGPYAAIIATAMGAITRYSFGGIGANAGLAFALFYGVSGIVARWILSRQNQILPSIKFAIGLGILSTSLSGLATFLLPADIQIKLLTTLWPQLIVANVIGSVIFTSLLKQVELKAKHSESLEMIKYLLDHIRDATYLADRTGHLKLVNQEAINMLGYTRDELLNMRVMDVDDKESSQEQWDIAWENIREQGSIVFESVHKDKHGALVPVEINASHFEFAGVEYIAGIVRDIRERLNSQREITESSERFNAVLTTTPDGFWLVNNNGELIEVNQAYCSMSGYSRDELLSMRIRDLDMQMSDSEIAERMKHIIDVGSAVFETEHKRKDGSTWPVEVSVSYSELQGGCVFSLLRDISERKEAIRKIEQMAYYDTLTGLPNRQLLTDRLNQAIANCRRLENMLGICYIDLDGFKPVNDQYGHETGDRLLAEFSKRMIHKMREGDTLARLGGDEFVLILSNLSNVYQVEDILTRLLKDISQPFDITSYRIEISSSIGVTIYPMDDSDGDSLLRHADQAMYRAKNEGKNTFRFYDPIQEYKVHHHREEIDELRKALSNSELELYFQPRIDLHDGSLNSAETLVRWNHPEKGMLLPGEFLPHIANHPLEILLDEWVLESALKMYQTWNENGFTLPISVNLSPRSIQNTGFVKFLKGLTERYPLQKPGHLELEVLENIAVTDIDQISEIMKSCLKLGVCFSLDDFGTGFSSLTYFHRLPVQIVKIDKQFVTDMHINQHSFNIVDSVIKMASALKRPVVAEGVESLEIARALMQMDCYLVQGFGIARPMPASEVRDWYQGWGREKQWHRLGEN